MVNSDQCSEIHLKAMFKRIDNLGTSLWDNIWSPVLSAQALPGFDPVMAIEKCKLFLANARHRCLQFARWDSDCLKGKELFLESLPATATQKFDGYMTDSCRSKYNAVKSLLDLHNGEIVQVHTASWKLIPFHVRMFQALPEQFELGPNYCSPKLMECEMSLSLT